MQSQIASAWTKSRAMAATALGAAADKMQAKSGSHEYNDDPYDR